MINCLAEFIVLKKKRKKFIHRASFDLQTEKKERKLKFQYKSLIIMIFKQKQINL